jgi:hypothetical protein
MVVMPLLQNIALLLALIVGYDMLSDTISSILPAGQIDANVSVRRRESEGTEVMITFDEKISRSSPIGGGA